MIDNQQLMQTVQHLAHDMLTWVGFGTLSAYEKVWFDKMIPDLKKQIAKGIEFANAKPAAA